MRGLCRAACAVSAIAFSLGAASAAASAAEALSCRSLAWAAADEWAAGHINAEDDAAMVPPSRVVIIAYGRKYSVPRSTVDNADLHLKPVGELAIERQQVYNEELDRCLGHFTVELADVDHLTFQEVRDYVAHRHP